MDELQVRSIYKWYILPIGGLYAAYHLLGEPETTIDKSLFFSERGLPFSDSNPKIWAWNIQGVVLLQWNMSPVIVPQVSE